MWAKLKREWKTFFLALVTTITGGWQFAVASGANLPDLLFWLPEQYKSSALLIVGVLFLLLRKYTDSIQTETVTTTVTPEENKTEITTTTSPAEVK